MTEGEYVCCNYEEADVTDCEKKNSTESFCILQNNVTKALVNNKLILGVTGDITMLVR